jgi:hypothetical protein
MSFVHGLIADMSVGLKVIAEASHLEPLEVDRRARQVKVDLPRELCHLSHQVASVGR